MSHEGNLRRLSLLSAGGVTVETGTCGGSGRCTSCSSSHADWPMHAPVVINICTCKRELRQGKFGRRFSPAPCIRKQEGAGVCAANTHTFTFTFRLCVLTLQRLTFAKPANPYSCTFGGTAGVLGHWVEWWPPSPFFLLRGAKKDDNRKQSCSSTNGDYHSMSARKWKKQLSAKTSCKLSLHETGSLIHSCAVPRLVCV